MPSGVEVGMQEEGGLTGRESAHGAPFLDWPVSTNRV